MFRPLIFPFLGHYEYVRSIKTGKLVGVELQCSGYAPDEQKKGLDLCPVLVRVQDRERYGEYVDWGVWRLYFCAPEDSEIQWEQYATGGAYISESGDLLLIIPTEGLADNEYAQLQAIATEVGEERGDAKGDRSI